ncbi:Non-specific protein-tyrosine kinase [Aphelenchoides besseyi]|nr:Non-specific protein-tyrosine kinase [Aphelenchoides besseyi]KAI6210671.1 Non-specific protein-tyrosine kinase [Aphelenchoides besseyi]
MPTIQIEESLHDALKETDLLSFQHVLVAEKQLTKIEHFQHVTDDELQSYGLSVPAVRRLRNALDRRKKSKKPKLFSKPKPTRYINAECAPSTSKPQPAADNSTSTSTAPCLIARDDVTLSEKLGEGTFASVKRGIWQRSGSLIKTDCAVKILHQMSEHAIEDLHAEIAHMQKLKHQNVVQLYGIVLGEPTMMVIEYCDGGSLLNRLRNKKKPVLLVTKLLSYALQISSGMAYLESRRCVHRDLACRNVLLTENEDVIKICDFGLTRSLNDNERMYVMHAQKKVPFAWCPPESLRKREFSHKSDCWAFGVTLWELYTYGEEPWAGHRAAEVLQLTENGEQLKKPRKCLQEIYNVMLMCWNLDAELRPKFGHLKNLLLDIKFMTAETRESFISDEPDSLELSVGDHVIIISEHDQKEWFGQCVGSRKFGRFPYSLVSVKSHRVSNTSPNKNATVTSPAVLAAASSSYSLDPQGYISKPVPGSLIHAGHGDIDENKCWGHVDRIDEIYLKNPAIKPSSLDGRPRGVSFISSVAALHEDYPANGSSVNNVRPSPVVKLDYDPLKAWDMPNVPITPSAQKVSVIPTKSVIKPPTVPTKPATTTKSDAFNSLRSEYERLKAEQLKTTSQTTTASSTTQKYSTTTAVPRPHSALVNQRSFESIQSARSTTSATNLDGFFSQPTQPAVSTAPISSSTAPSNSLTTQSNLAIESLEDDPFVVDPTLKSLSLRNHTSTQQTAIPWRGTQTVQPLPIHSIQRPQSARLNDEHKITQKSTQLDPTLLALLDPLISAKAQTQPTQSNGTIQQIATQKVQSRPQSNVKIVSQTKTTDTSTSLQSTSIKQPIQTTTTSTNSSNPRINPSNRHSVTPSALNVLAYVTNNGTSNVKKDQSIQQKQMVTAQPSNPTPWSYFPPSATLQPTSQSAKTTVSETPRPSPVTQPLANTSNLSSNSSVNLPLQPVSTVSVASTSNPPTSRPASSLLPAPSQLLLDGFKKETTSSLSARTSDSAYGSLNSNSSVSKFTFNGSGLISDQFNFNSSNGSIGQQPIQQLYNVQHSSFNPSTFTQSANYISYQMPSVSSSSVYNSNNIPFLTPTPLEKKPTAQQTKAPTTIVSLNDLDFDSMISTIQKATFASTDQCTKALKASGYEVEQAIRHLKVEKLMETGLCAERSVAVQALNASNWNVNDAAIRLVS